jgi:hypothetical protein
LSSVIFPVWNGRVADCGFNADDGDDHQQKAVRASRSGRVEGSLLGYHLVALSWQKVQKDAVKMEMLKQRKLVVEAKATPSWSGGRLGDSRIPWTSKQEAGTGDVIDVYCFSWQRDTKRKARGLMSRMGPGVGNETSFNAGHIICLAAAGEAVLRGGSISERMQRWAEGTPRGRK